MDDPATAQWTALRVRYRQHLQRVRELMDEHCRVAMTVTGGKIRSAARIVQQRVAADEAFHREMEALEDLHVQLGFPCASVYRPSDHPKPRKSNKRGRR